MPNLTKSYIEQVAYPTTSVQKFEWDDSMKSFGVRVTAASKTFIVDRKFNGRTVRLSIGRFPEWTVPQARERARELIVMMDKGIDPRLEAKKKAQESVTLEALFNKFMSERQLKERTQSDYSRYLNHYLSSWKNKPITRITADMISKRYAEIAESSSGSSQASSVMRFLRSVLNYAQAHYGTEILPANPVATLTAKRTWIREAPRTDHLHMHEIRPFIQTLRLLPNKVMGAYLEFMLLTGARRSEAASLKWKDVHTRAKTLTFKDTKNHTDRTIPITPRLEELLELMKNWRMGDYVFGSMGRDGKAGRICEPRKAMLRANKAAGSEVTVYGLRRTFATVLESLDCPAYPLKALLGHSMKGDVTASHYTQIGVERLRPWLEKYECLMLKLINGSQDVKDKEVDAIEN